MARLRARLALWPRKSASHSRVRFVHVYAHDTRVLASAHACGRTGEYPHCYGYISGCLSCEKELGSSP